MAKLSEYDTLEEIGKGSYGVVMKARHWPTATIVALKRYIDTDDDKCTHKVIQRELRALRALRHENIVQLLASFRRRRRTYLVFEYIQHTLLDEIEAAASTQASTMDKYIVRQYMWQIFAALHYAHTRHCIMHRDIKPENVLIDRAAGIVKLCDFGFAKRNNIIDAKSRVLCQQQHTDYVATRWYRAPELLCGERRYDFSIDVWACGCLMAEMILCAPLFAGESDMDQLYRIVRAIGPLPKPLAQHLQRNNNNRNENEHVSQEDNNTTTACVSALSMPKRGYRLDDIFAASSSSSSMQPSGISLHALALIQQCLQMDCAYRPTIRDCMHHDYFRHDAFHEQFPPQLNVKIQRKMERLYAFNDYLRQQLRQSCSLGFSYNNIQRTVSSVGTQSPVQQRLRMPKQHQQRQEAALLPALPQQQRYCNDNSSSCKDDDAAATSTMPYCTAINQLPWENYCRLPLPVSPVPAASLTTRIKFKEATKVSPSFSTTTYQHTSFHNNTNARQTWGTFARDDGSIKQHRVVEGAKCSAKISPQAQHHKPPRAEIYPCNNEAEDDNYPSLEKTTHNKHHHEGRKHHVLPQQQYNMLPPGSWDNRRLFTSDHPPSPPSGVRFAVAHTHLPTTTLSSNRYCDVTIAPADSAFSPPSSSRLLYDQILPPSKTRACFISMNNSA